MALITGLVGGFGIVAAAREGSGLAAIVPLLAVGLVIWIWTSTRYVISGRELVVRSYGSSRPAFEAVRKMRLHRPLADRELVRNLRVRLPVGHQAQ